MSYKSEPIRYRDHVRWLQEKLNDRHTRLLIALNARHDEVGSVRLNVSAISAEISISVARDYRNQGFGTVMIGLGARFAVEDLGLESVIANIKRSNSASLAAFRKAGFVQSVTLSVEGPDSVQMIYRGDSVRALREK
jgi:RimJ/RimL family protein N-acetyltransferase